VSEILGQAMALARHRPEGILHDLSVEDPIWDHDDIVGCNHCSNEFNHRQHGQHPDAHRPWCVWRRAREWVAAHPTEAAP
jgi:hypothetical protein